MDVAAQIHSRAKTVHSSTLASRLETVRVLDFSTITALIQEAVDTAVQNLGKELGRKERLRLVREAEEFFEKRLTALSAEKAGQEEKIQHLQEQFEMAQSLLEEERQKIVRADQFTVSDAGMAEMEKRLGRMLDRAIRDGGVGGELERDMRAVVAKLLDDERDNIRRQAEEAQGEKVSLLERKIDRLAKTLEKAQKERDKERRRVQALEAVSAGPGFKLTRQPGIEEDDPDKRRKLDLMKEIFQVNKEIREELAKSGALPRGRGSKQAPRKPEKAPARGSKKRKKSSFTDTEVSVSDSAGVKKIQVKKVETPSGSPDNAAVREDDTEIVSGRKAAAGSGKEAATGPSGSGKVHQGRSVKQ